MGLILRLGGVYETRGDSCVVRPCDSTRFDINVAGENHYIRVAGGGIEPSELEVQVRVNLNFHNRPSFDLVVLWMPLRRPASEHGSPCKERLRLRTWIKKSLEYL